MRTNYLFGIIEKGLYIKRGIRDMLNHINNIFAKQLDVENTQEIYITPFTIVMWLIGVFIILLASIEQIF